VALVLEEMIVLADYDPAWPKTFEALAARAAAALTPIPARIEHVGSTSVPGLPAKPVIDLDVVVAAADVPHAIERLAALSYAHRGNGGLPGREAFRWPPGEARHHLYLCTPDTPAFRDHILFRDHLRTNPEVAREYGAFKRELAARYGADRAAYQSGKAGFIDAIMRVIEPS
jgi:GrpB-like predicted nucleotidyltransferase (UPF0157 family)